SPRSGRHAHANVLPLHWLLDYWSSAGRLAVLSARMGRFRPVGRPEPGAHFDRYRLAFRLAAHSPSLSTRWLTQAGGNITSGWKLARFALTSCSGRGPRRKVHRA